MSVAWLTTGIRPALLVGAAALAAYALLFADAYGLRVLTVAGIYALLVIGYQFIFGQAGALSLAQCAFFGLGAYATGILGTALGWPFALTFPASILVPVALAAAIALPVLRLGSHYFALATLGIGQVVLIVAVNWESVTGGANGIAGAILGAVLLVHLPEWFRFLEGYYLMAYGAGALAFIILAPEGLVGALESLRARLWPEPPKPAPAHVEPRATARAAPKDGSTLLEIEGLTKSYGGVAALDSVSLSIQPGEIFALIGPNGSGKTTLVNLVTGLDRPDAGRVRFEGLDVTDAPTHRMARAGVARGFQAVSLVEDMSALDNVAAACGIGTAGRGGAAFARARGEAVAYLGSVGAADWAMRAAGELPPGARRRVEIARALALQPTLLILDEPAAGLTAAEQADLARRLEALAAAGMALLVIEHDMGFLMPLAHRVACLEEGRLIATGTPEEIGADARVIAAYLGAPITEAGG